MNCLTDDQVIALVVGGPTVAGHDHLRGCLACSARVEQVRERMRRLEAALATLDRGHQAGRARLLAALAEAPAPTRSLFRRIVMNRRNWALAAATAVIVLLLLPWGGAGPASLADTLRPFKEAKSFACDVVPLAGGQPVGDRKKLQTRLLWAAPGSLRSDMSIGGKRQSTVIAPAGKKGLLLDHKARTYTPTEVRPGIQEAAILRLIKGLASYSSGDDKPAGTDEVGGVKAPRFDVKVGDENSGVWRYRVWAHPRTKRPLRVDLALRPGQEPGANGLPALRLENFDWDVKVNGSFDTQPPKGYRLAAAKPAAATVEQMTKQIVASLKAYREVSKGYPKMEPFNGAKAAGELEKLTKRKTEADLLTGFLAIGALQARSKEAVYRGQTVGPEDKGKVLFRWKLDDGSYRVIFGDLQTRTVSAEKLKEVEAK
jgi:hypothetical protein